MLASLLSPTSTTSTASPPGRISQLLPTVKCSTCHQPVPLDELGEHTCEAPPPVPSLPKPSISPEQATSLLPGRLQGRVASSSSSSSSRAGPSQEHQRIPSSSSRLRVNTSSKGPGSPTQAGFQPKSSPLARADSSSPSIREVPFPSSSSSSPLRTRPPDPMRMRTTSNAGSISTPSTARPPVSFNQNQNQDSTTGGFRKPSFSGSLRGPPPSRNGTPQPNFPPPRSGPSPAPPTNYNAPPPRSGPSPAPPAGYNNGPPRPPTSMSMGGPRSMSSGPGAPPPRPPDMRLPPDPRPTPNNDEFVPPAERGIDTKSGGAAGMAGVGRRGFAAAARAAMFVQPPRAPQQMGYANGGAGGNGFGDRNGNGGNGNGRRPPNAPKFLDIDAATRSATETPPLSAGSGYSSHSPGPTSPLPQDTFPSTMAANAKNPLNLSLNQPREPSPARGMTPTRGNPNASGLPPSPRLPFFEKLKNKLPGMVGYPAQDEEPLGSAVDTPRARADSSASAMSRSQGSSQRGLSRERPPMSPVDSESEYGGLAYADSNATDYEDDYEERLGRSGSSRSGGVPRSAGGRSRSGSVSTGRSESLSSRSGGRRRSRSPPPVPPLPTSTTLAAAASILNSSAASSSQSKGHIQFGSVSLRSRSRSTSNDRGDIRIGSTTSRSTSIRSILDRPPVPGHSRDNSVASSYSSTSSIGRDADREREGRSITPGQGRARKDSAAAIAQALGLSRTPPSDYAKLGGPGVGVGRSGSGRSVNGREGGLSRGISNGKEREAYGHSRGVSAGSAREREGVRREAEGTGKQRSLGGGSGSSLKGMNIKSAGRLGREEYGASKSSSSSNTYDNDDEENDSVLGLGGAKAQRSNTVHSPEARDSKPIKLPMRSLTSPQLDRDKALDGGAAGARGVMKKTRRPKTCLRCQKVIEDGRWVSVDGGGVLCERCWKGMYLPKCRRCNLPIEGAAVSSSGGQLKGKFHKECFNCHICHKPFPDKSFYVYDGKPLCAYHYHEANDSLCAAARCGQPIEGPCAVSHSGDRYHPEHMTCEYPGGVSECGEVLREYWEVEGRMLCERHAAGAVRGSGSGSEDGDAGGGIGIGAGGRGSGGRSRKAMKRVTRFIDLAGGDIGLR